MNTLGFTGKGDAGIAGSESAAGASILLERKSVLMGMAASVGLVFANAAQPSAAAAASKVRPSAFATGTVAVVAPSQGRRADLDTLRHGEVADDFTELSQWRLAGTGAATFGDTSQAALGAPVALKVVTDGNGKTYTMERDLLLDGYAKFVSFMLLADAPASQIDFGVMVNGSTYSSTSFSKSGVVLSGSLGGGSYVFRPGIAHRVTVPLAMLGTNGSTPPTEAMIHDVRALHLGFKDKGTGAATFYVWDFKIHDNPFPPGIVFIFDDARYDWYTKAIPILEAAEFVGVNAVPTALVAGTGGSGTVISGSARCAWADLLDAQARGHELVNHSRNHIGLAGVSPTTARNEILGGRADLISHGADPAAAEFFVYPGGQHDATSLSIAKTICRASRSVISVNNSLNGNFETPQVAEMERLRTLYMLNTVPVSEATGIIDRMVSRGGQAIFTFHSIADTNPGADAVTYLTTDFQAIVTYAKNAGLKSYTMTDLWGRK